MKSKLFFLLIFLPAVKSFAQTYIFGKVRAENSTEVPGAVVINTRTDEKTLTDSQGNFMLAAALKDEIRIVKSGFDRASITVEPSGLSETLNISLTKAATLIPEVELAFRPSGNIKKDTKALDLPKKVVALNTDIRNSFKNKVEVLPTNAPPSAFAPRNLGAGQIDMVGAAGALVSLFRKATEKPKTTANFAETQEFYSRVKSTVDMAYFTKYGLDEYGFETYLIYCDKRFALAKNYRENFNIRAIESVLKIHLEKYLNTINRVEG